MNDDLTRLTGVPLELARAIDELALTDRLLVALDFDGTVSAFVDDPAQSRVAPIAAAAIARLEQLHDTWVAFVSGRSLDGLIVVSGADDATLLVGSHGAQVRLGGGAGEIDLDDDARSRMVALTRELQAVVDATPGAHLEHKPVGLGLHVRTVDPGLVPQAYADARAAAERIGGFLERDGKDILEFAAAHDTKGDGVELLRAHVNATAVLYAGDDVTDEDGFRVMREGDLGLKVGEGETLARYRVSDPDAVGRVLELLAAVRSAQR